MDEVRDQQFRDEEENPYDRNTADYMKIGDSGLERAEELDTDLLEHVLAMDARAAARPVVQNVTDEVFNSGNEEIVDTGYQNLNRASDDFLSNYKIHGNPDALGAATVYMSGLTNNEITHQPSAERQISDAANIGVDTMKDRLDGLYSDIVK